MISKIIFLYLITFALIVIVINIGNKNSRNRYLSKHPVLIVVSYDGFRHNYFQRTSTPNLDQLRDAGVSVDFMRSQFVSKTFPNHMSIVTGLHTESHGVVNSAFYDPVYNRTLDYSQKEFWNLDNLTTPLWTLNELQYKNRQSGMIMWPGSAFPYEGIPPYRLLRWNESYPYEDRVDLALEWITDKNHPVNLVFIYFDVPDKVAHLYGPESPQVTEYIKVVDNITGYLSRRLKEFGIYDDVNLILLSDHGFHEVKEENIIDYSEALVPDTYQTFGSSPVVHILPNEGMTEQVYLSLKNLSKRENFSVLKKEEMEPSWFYRNNRRIMPIVIVADLGFVFQDFKKSIEFYREKFNVTLTPGRVYGTHGYDNRQQSMHSFFIGHGPAFRSGYKGDNFDNVDVYPLICKILNLLPRPNNGSMNNVQKLLKTKTIIMKSQTGWKIQLVGIFGGACSLAMLIVFVTRKRIRNRADMYSRIFIL